jgi:hypothetical protein
MTYSFDDYRNQKQAVEAAQQQLRIIEESLLANSGFLPGTRVRPKADNVVGDYYVFQCQLWREHCYWLTLTKRRKDGSMPKKPIDPVYFTDNEIYPFAP